MLKIVIFRGGLGNQMFIYAFYMALKNYFKLSFFQIVPIDCFLVHNGYELPNIFSNINSKSYRFYRRIQKSYSEYFTKNLFKIIIENEPGNFFTEYTKYNFPLLVYDGFWQSEKYFKNLSSKIIRIFQFNENKLNENTRNLQWRLRFENSVSIHIRRNDYLKNNELGGICKLNYYQKAINYIEEHSYNSRYYVFTDDKEWVKNNFLFLKYKLVDWNELNESWQDMYLMSKCKHNIIANSSFSWWGAWLNQNKDKIVIAPSRWFKNWDAKDIVPQNWIRL